MKKYMKPTMEGQMFVSNEFVSACGDSGTTYIFECNAPAGDLYYYKDNNSNPTYLGGFTPNTSSIHYAESTADFFNGFVDYDGDKEHDTVEHTEKHWWGGSTTYPAETVIVWIEYGFDRWGNKTISNYHATKELDMNSWAVAKS